MFKPLATGLFAALLLSPLCLASQARAADSVDVYAAASLTDVMNALVEQYEENHDVDLVPVYASSSTLARQIGEGAPADVYLSANVKWMDWLQDQGGVVVSQRHNLLRNRLALIAPDDTDIPSFTPDAEHPLVDYLEDGERVSVGDPAHVPAGIYAKQAFESTGQWQTLEPRLARGSDVRAALALVERGETPLGVVYATDAQASDGVKQLGLFPADSHDPIIYPAALIGEHPGDAAGAFLDWLSSDAARETFEQYGFEMAND
ncbi:molybdate ABC transporter substrate-binding protein [Kushneria aurantia]|uniref:Molybdate ABC transporter substrate-binding protein n=1 Tax=Kushneria aurantia TaxID=504092 RepID=A0ABV6G150_9GAMM|nr:molybdate ABC transporter substrate-binding protein [Kushneria aurantia]